MSEKDQEKYDEEDVVAILEKDDSSHGPGFSSSNELAESDYVEEESQ